MLACYEADMSLLKERETIGDCVGYKHVAPPEQKQPAEQEQCRGAETAIKLSLLLGVNDARRWNQYSAANAAAVSSARINIASSTVSMGERVAGVSV